jgi:hypothetical protein
MSEAGQILALLAALSLLASLAIWAALLRGPLLQRLDGQPASNAGLTALVIQLLMLAVGLSAVAAVLAVVGGMFL